MTKKMHVFLFPRSEISTCEILNCFPVGERKQVKLTSTACFIQSDVSKIL